ncbi:MAG: RluA family pseudouridine synthase [Clostridia bacterium]|nr:RluA family pseudouridine synthase [Clostridia bacterium]
MAEGWGEIPVLYEDNHLLVAVKPAGVLSQPDGSEAPDMLALLKEGIRIRHNKPGNIFLGLVHRLDRPVGGVMVFARTSKGASRLSAQIRERRFGKEYIAVLRGMPRDPVGTLRDYMVRNGPDGRSGFTSSEGEGKEAVLRYQVMDRLPDGGASLVRIRLETGRTHQIRAQFARIGCPVWGDARYGGPDAGSGVKGGIALFACGIAFLHPVRGEPMRFTALPDPDGPWGMFADRLRAGLPEWDGWETDHGQKQETQP